MAAKKSTTSSKKKTSSGTKQSTTKKVEKVVKKEIKKGIRKNAKKKPLVALGLVVLLVAVTAAFAYLEKSGTTHVFHDAPADPVTFNGIVYDDLQINFMELGNWYTGDSVYIKAGTVDILIDAGSRKNSAARIEEFIDAHSEDKVLDYVIATHAHEDHIAGFSGTDKSGVFYKYQIGTIIDFAKTDSNSGIYKDYLAA
ncbi:MAG: MBL fold metallo-hydrolase, partial [Bacilli bacterium]|nr:MBL fold metallo-hydrolase [Bacilli bacterium]